MIAGKKSAKKNSKPKNEKPKRHLAGAGEIPSSWRKPEAMGPGRGMSLFVPTLRFTPYAWSKLLFLRDLGQTEVGGFGISSEHDLFLIEDVRLIRQNCTALSVAFEDEAVADFFDEQIDAGRQPERFGRVWVHTHPGNSAEPSSTDEETFARVFDSAAWSVMFILAKGGETYARLKFGCGPGAELLCRWRSLGMCPLRDLTMTPGSRNTNTASEPIVSAPIPSANQLSPEDRAFLEANPDLLDEFGFPLLDYDDPRLELLESDMAFYDQPRRLQLPLTDFPGRRNWFPRKSSPNSRPP